MTRARGEGSVYRNPDRDNWIAQIRINGRKVKRSAPTQRDAVRLLAAMRRDRDKGLDVTRITVGAFLEDWLAHKAQDGTRVNTLRGYVSKVRTHLAPRLGVLTLAELTPRHVEAATRAMIEAGSSPRTAAHCRTVLANALHDAERWGMVERNAAALAVPPRVEAAERTALSVAQIRQLEAALAGHDWAALYALAYTLGVREGEALALEWADVDLEAGTLRISRTVRRIGGQDVYEPPKSRRSRRPLPLSPALVAALRATRVRQAEARLRAGSFWQRSALVFTTADGRSLSPTTALRQLQAALEAAGLPRVTFHDLRHSAASMMAAEGIPAPVVAAILGHAHVSTTLDVYTHVPDAITREAVERLAASLAAPR